MKTVKKIDIHVHTSSSGWMALYKMAFLKPEELLAAYDERGIERGVILPSATSMAPTTNWEAKCIADRYPDRFSWFCLFSPDAWAYSDKTDFRPYIEECKQNGARGVGEMTFNHYFDSPRMLNLLAQCEELEMPFLFHMGQLGDDYGLVDEIGMPRLESVLKRFPRLKLIGHSQRFWAEISGDLTEAERGGYPKGRVAEGGRITALMRTYPNLYCDLSAGSGYNAMARDEEHAYRFLEEFSDRIFYGTDVCNARGLNADFWKLSTMIDRAMQEKKISYDAYYKISRGNALALLGLKEPEGTL